LQNCNCCCEALRTAVEPNAQIAFSEQVELVGSGSPLFLYLYGGVAMLRKRAKQPVQLLMKMRRDAEEETLDHPAQKL
jgi:hypothetical protein